MDLELFILTRKSRQFAARYERINSLEYGQKAGRRLGLTIRRLPGGPFLSKERGGTF
jgi:hypothetical protein